MTSSMALRTRLFGRLLKISEKGIEDVVDLPAHRAKRAKLQRTAIGGLIFGRPDPAATVDELVIGTGQRALVHRPEDAIGPLPCVVNFHGGGWVQGNPEQSAWLASRIAVRGRAVVVSPAYRLAPEHEFPAGVDDARDSLAWVVEHAEELGVDPQRIAVMGDSAGGNLAAVVSLMARDAGGPPIRAQVLIYPGVEMYDRWPSEDRNADAPVLTSANMRAFARLYLGEQHGTEDFRASPIRASSHADLPKAFILTAEADPLLDNGSRYRDALVEAGVPVRYVEYDGAIHGFMSLPGVVPVARRALDDIVDFLREVL
ncbi:alpha/beta hydrolase [Aeromicrobium sp. Root472D3]|uniref:alpha/beta hydrolase n=1 Tax=Aeromicrobium sp. Root472D3 TaxID=1736540 RepID=UPI000701349E|nr:alpha/beta hydrolase [Aeromicrobium sp. Root472D3]KQX72504.1 carboxylesterase [Aeromicrobium sp. Root472D3]